MAKGDLQDFINSGFIDKYKENLDTETTRQKIIKVFNEEIKKTDFADLVKKYAGEEMDKRVFRSFKYWGIVILTAFISTMIGVLVAKWLKIS